jgi:opacity protein-like surface antigen
MKTWMMVCVSTLGLATGSASAADTGFYFGLSGGQAKYDFERPNLPTVEFNPPPITELPPAALAPIAGVVVPIAFIPAGWQPGDDDESGAFGALVGFRFNRFAAIETSYLDLGTLEATEILNLFPTGQTTYRKELHSTGATISALGQWPITDRWSLYARAGALFARMKLKSSFSDFSDDISFGSQNFIWGAGTQFDWGTHWSLRLDFQRFDNVGEVMEGGRADIDTLTLGVLFRL